MRGDDDEGDTYADEGAVLQSWHLDLSEYFTIVAPEQKLRNICSNTIAAGIIIDLGNCRKQCFKSNSFPLYYSTRVEIVRSSQKSCRGDSLSRGRHWRRSRRGGDGQRRRGCDARTRRRRRRRCFEGGRAGTNGQMAYENSIYFDIIFHQTYKTFGWVEYL